MARTKKKVWNYKKGSDGYERQKMRPVSREILNQAEEKAFAVVDKMTEEREEKREIQREEEYRRGGKATGRRFERDEGPGINIPKGTALYAIERANAAPGGRPSIYDPLRFPHIAYVLCKERGFTNEELARVFDVSVKTVNQWMWQKEKVSFRNAVRRGRDEFDSSNVEQALKKRALGYEYTERHVTKTRLVGKTPEGVDVSVPAVSTTEITKHVQPETKAIMYWLQNRQPDRWKNTIHVKPELPADHEEAENEIDIEDMSTEELIALRDIASKAVEIQQKTIDVTPREKRLDSVEDILAAADAMQEHYAQQEALESQKDDAPKRGKR